ncbi:hypothetical protein FDUTEX481_05922 [Tolypothrix sp. PCC 7601]|nr:hypothetical protein FDUTEX481_05922 [Tolypothrix sp. PCC 7601]
MSLKGLPRNKLFHLVGRASCPPHKLGGQDVHPTINTGIFFYLEVPNSRFYAANTPTAQKKNNSPFPIPHSPFPIPHSPFPIPHSPIPIPHSPIPIPHSPFPIPPFSCDNSKGHAL